MACHGLCLPSDRNFIADLTAPEKKKKFVLKFTTHWELIVLKHSEEKSHGASALWINVSNPVRSRKLGGIQLILCAYDS